MLYCMESFCTKLRCTYASVHVGCAHEIQFDWEKNPNSPQDYHMSGVLSFPPPFFSISTWRQMNTTCNNFDICIAIQTFLHNVVGFFQSPNRRLRVFHVSDRRQRGGQLQEHKRITVPDMCLLITKLLKNEDMLNWSLSQQVIGTCKSRHCTVIIKLSACFDMKLWGEKNRGLYYNKCMKIINDTEGKL